MILDIHTHTSEHSACSQQTLEQLIRQAADLPLSGVVLTDHDHCWPAMALESAVTALGLASLTVLSGEEVTCPDGHLLVYGVKEHVPRSLGRVDAAGWVRQHGGVAILAHPFRWGGFAEVSDADLVATLRQFDGVEAWTTNHSEADLARARGFLGVPGVRLTGASDAHATDRLGRYAMEFPGDIRTVPDLVGFLRFGTYRVVERSADGCFRPCS